MLLTESGSNSCNHRRIFEQRRPGFALNYRGHRQFGPFHVSCGDDSSPLAVRQPLQVVTRRHHRHCKVGSRLANGADQFATHLLYGRKRMFNSGTGLGNSVIAPLLSVGQRLVPMGFALNSVPVAIRFEPGCAFFGGIASVGVDIPTRVGRVYDGFEVLAVMGAGGVGDDLADEFVRLVDVDREFVAMMALAMFLGPGGIQVLLASLGGFPIRGHGVFLEGLLITLGEVLPGCRYQCGVDDLAAAGNEALLEQLRGHTIEDGFGAGLTNPVLEDPHGGPVRDVGGLGQSAEALVTHAVQQLVFHLFVRQVVQTLQDQYAYHGLGGKRWSASLWANRSRRNAINFCRQSHKVDAALDLGERVTQPVQGLLVMQVSK